MYARTFLIAGGNATRLYWNCPLPERATTALCALRDVEQVGFVDHDEQGVPTLSMMGGELCVNALLALASLRGGDGTLRTSGNDTVISYGMNEDGGVHISFPLMFTHYENIVCFQGIGYICKKGEGTYSKNELALLAQTHSMPAFGAIFYEGPKIIPYVYVAGTDSLCKETACGSGSIAFNILTGVHKVEQPTGEYITVMREGGVCTVCASVREIA